MPDPIAVLVHVSDLHIGELDPVNGNAKLSRSAGTLVKNTAAFDGLLGHQARSLRDLAAYVKDLKKTHPALRVVVTGDYTRSGGAAEHELSWRDGDPPASGSFW